MFTVRLSRWKWKERPDGTAPVYVVVHAAGRRSTVTTGVYVRDRDWNEPKGEVRKTHANHVAMNRALRDALTAAQDAAGDTMSVRGQRQPHAVTRAVRGDTRRDTGDFIGYAESRIEQFFRSGQFATAAAHRTAVKKLRAMVGGRLGYSELTPELLRTYQAHLVDHYGNKPNTVHKNVTCLRTLFYDAVKDGRASGNPFKHLRLRKVDSMPRSLTMDEFRAVESVELSGEWDTLSRDMFVFAVYAGGMRFSDVCRIRHGDIRYDGTEYRIMYRQKKTDTPVMVVLLPGARAVIERYGWPGPDDERVFPVIGDVAPRSRQEFSSIASANVMANKGLKRVGRIAGVGRLTTHMARHTLANVLADAGVDVRKIGGILGQRRIQTTEQYIKRLRGAAADDELRDVFG